MKLEQLGSDNQDDYLHTGEDLLESARLLMEYHELESMASRARFDFLRNYQAITTPYGLDIARVEAKRHADLYARAVRLNTFLEVDK